MRAIVFDCFGVLYVPVSQLYFKSFPEHHQELSDLNRMSDRGLMDRMAYITAVAKLTGVSEDETIRAFSKEYTANRPLIDFMRQSLKPQYKIGLLSNIGRGWIQDFFDEHQLHDLFDAVVLSSEEGITKPNQLIFERAAERLGVFPSECLMIDDSKENCKGAEAVGMSAVLYDETLSNDKLKAVVAEWDKKPPKIKGEESA